MDTNKISLVAADKADQRMQVGLADAVLAVRDDKSYRFWNDVHTQEYCVKVVHPAVRSRAAE